MSDTGLKELVVYIARALVDRPDDVVVTEIKGTQTSVIELKVAKDDLGKVGKKLLPRDSGTAETGPSHYGVSKVGVGQIAIEAGTCEIGLPKVGITRVTKQPRPLQVGAAEVGKGKVANARSGEVLLGQVPPRDAAEGNPLQILGLVAGGGIKLRLREADCQRKRCPSHHRVTEVGAADKDTPERPKVRLCEIGLTEVGIRQVNYVELRV